MTMLNADERLKKDLILKEELLLDNIVRIDAKKISELIDASYTEFTEIGTQAKWRPGDPFEVQNGVLYIDSSTVKLVDLSDDCKLLLFVSAKVNKNSRQKANCSSVWRKNDGKWKLAFHQRTNCCE
jgi:hypothetical protein